MVNSKFNEIFIKDNNKEQRPESSNSLVTNENITSIIDKEILDSKNVKNQIENFLKLPTNDKICWVFKNIIDFSENKFTKFHYNEDLEKSTIEPIIEYDKIEINQLMSYGDELKEFYKQK